MTSNEQEHRLRVEEDVLHIRPLTQIGISSSMVDEDCLTGLAKTLNHLPKIGSSSSRGEALVSDVLKCASHVKRFLIFCARGVLMRRSSLGHEPCFRNGHSPSHGIPGPYGLVPGISALAILLVIFVPGPRQNGFQCSSGMLSVELQIASILSANSKGFASSSKQSETWPSGSPSIS